MFIRFSTKKAKQVTKKRRDFTAAFERFNRFYFKSDCVYDEKDFERRFCMPKPLYRRICESIIGRDIFIQRKDAAGRNGIHPEMRIMAGLRVLAYGSSFDAIDELLEISETAVRQSFHSFVKNIIDVFGDEYLRPPTEEDLKQILRINFQRGFPGCIGSWDCQHWEWKNCPVSWAGQFKGKEKKPSVVLETIADFELRIWGCNVGSPGSLNDINILDSSSIVSEILNGQMLPGFKYTVNGNVRNNCYYLVDGIYPKWSILVSTINDAISKKEKHCSLCQEGMRKDVERAIGVLVSRWHLLTKPCATWNKEMMVMVMKTAIIMHNMIVELRRDGYCSEIHALATDAIEKGFFLNEDYEEKQFKWMTKDKMESALNRVISDAAWAHHLSNRESFIMDEVHHWSLKTDLIEHIWKNWGCH